MTRKIARLSEITPSKTIDEYLWNERLGVTQLPPVNPDQSQSPLSSLPPQSSQAPAIDYGASNGQSDLYGMGVSGAEQLIAPQPKQPQTSSTPAVSKAASIGAFDLAQHLMDEHYLSANEIRDHEENVKLHDSDHASGDNYPYYGTDGPGTGHRHAAVSTLYGDVNPIPTTGDGGDNSSYTGTSPEPEETPGSPTAPKLNPEEGAPEEAAGAAADLGEAASALALASKRLSGNGSQANRNDSSEHLPNGPDSRPEGNIANDEEGPAGLASNLGEKSSLALLASKRWVGSTLDPKEGELEMSNWSERYAGKKDKEEGHYKYIKHRNGKWVIIQKGTGKVLSTHDSREKAIAAFKAMESHLHG